ncbi:MAG: hypothetical protein MI976_30120 [Pseudomonadales bacterium]|nr:hypothetical protein [Pseudomonadales bacterium]
MVRKLTAALLGVGVFVPGLANALGLGEIKLNSHLSEPLNAEIELVQVRELTEGEILPGLASSDDFTSAGVERFHHLTDMKFEVVVNSSGRSYIKVKTRKPIREPFVNFLVEVHWPAGRLLREYTLLLDPPNFSLAAPQPVQAAVTAPQPATPASAPTTKPASQSQSSSVSAPVTTAPSTAPTTSSSTSGGGKTYGPTKGSDSLWSIAKVLRPSDEVSMHQTMIAIQQLNPDAFINGNINLLKKGKILRGPSVAEASQYTNNEAVNLVQQQNRAWKERISSPSTAAETETAQIDTSGRAVDSFEETVRSDEGRLRLVSSDTETGAADSGQGGSSGDDGVLRQRAELAEESADKFRLENEDLKGKVTELEEQVGTSEKLLDLKDDQIAALQARLAKLEDQIKQQAESGEPGATQEMTAQVEEPGEVVETPVIEPALEPESEPEMVADEPEEPVDYNFEEEQLQDSDGDSAVTEEPKPQQAIQVEQTPKKVVVDTPTESQAPQPAKEPSLLEQLTQNPLYMAIAGGGIAVLAILAFVVGRRKKEESDDIDEALVEDFSLNVEEDAPAIGDQLDVPAESEMGGEETVPQTADVLGEADIYIAYGRFPQAIEMLEKAAEAEPTRSDIRMKLLETSVEAKDQEAFMRHYHAVQELAVSEDMARADALKDQFVGNESFDSDFGDIAEPGDETLVADSAPEGSFEPESLMEPEPVAEVPSQDLDFSLDDEDATLVQPSVPETQEAKKTDEEAGLDFNFDLPESLDQPSDSGAEEASVADTSVDFDLDNEKAEDDTSLDFDSEFNLDLPEEVATDEGDAVVSFGEAEESLDFELAEEADELQVPTSEVPTSEVPGNEAPEDAMEFDLDLDSVGVDDEDDTLVAPPGGMQPSEGSEDVIDPDAAAKLADELDLDGDFDLDLDISETDSVETDVEAAADDLEFSVEEDVASEATEHQADVVAETDLDLDLDADIEMPSSEEQLDADSFDVEVAPAPAPIALAGDAANSEEELDFLTDADETSTKLDLARAYIDMGDREGAKDILDEVLIEGNEDQQGEAKDLLARLD